MVHADRGAAGQALAARCATIDQSSFSALVAEVAGRPVRLGAADVLVVHEVLQRVQQPRRAAGRRTASSSGGPLRSFSTSTAKSLPADPARLASVEPGQRRDARCPTAGGAALADQQVHDEVLDRPARRTGSAGPRRPRGRCRTARLRSVCGESVGHAADRSACEPVRPGPDRDEQGAGTLRDGFARPRGRDPARAVDLHALHARQRAVRRADRRRRLGARLGHRPRRAARVRRPATIADRRRWSRSLALFLGVAILRAVGIVARRLGAGVMQYRMQAHYRRDGHPAVPPAADGLAPAAPDRAAAVQRQLRRRGRLGADRAAADGGRHGRDDGDRGRPDAPHRPRARAGRAARLPAGDRRQRRLPAAVRRR